MTTTSPAAPALRLADLPVGRVEAGERNANLAHYLLAPYSSIETHYQTIVLIDPSRPAAALLRPGCRKVIRRNVLAVRLPSLDDLTPELATDLTNVAAPYFGIREWSRETRRAGRFAHDATFARVLSVPAPAPIKLTTGIRAA